MKFSRTGFIVLFFSLSLLVSCGGGGGGVALPNPNPNPNPNPTSSIISQGTASIPVNLGTAPLTYTNGTVAYGGHSYYQFTTAQAGSYIIKLTNTTVKMQWSLYSQKSDLGNFFANAIASADDIFTSAGDLVATASNLDANATYYLEVDDWDSTGGTYTIAVANGYSEGSLNTPITLIPDGSSHSGGIDGYGHSYYKFSTAAAGSYLVSFKGVSPQADIIEWNLYSDSGFSTQVTSCNYNTSTQTAGDLTCGASNLPAGTYYLRVYNYGSNVSYSVSVAPDGIGYAGTAATLSLSTGTTTTIYDNELQYYSFTLASSGTYSISLTTSQNISWALYSDATGSTRVTQCPWYSGSNATCTTPNLPRGTYYLQVTNNVSAAGSYNLIATGPWSEGAIADPVVLYSRTPYTDGHVDVSGTSYYKFVTESLLPSSAYLVTLTSPSFSQYTPISLSLFSDSAFSTSLGSCANRDYMGDFVCSTNQSGFSGVLSPNTAYYLTVNSSYGIYETYTATVSPLSSKAGCDGRAGATCYDFENNSMSPFVASGNTIPLWTISTLTSGSTGSYNAQSGITGKNQTSSCFQTSATGVKWVTFSLNTNFTNATTTQPDSFDFYIDPPAISSAWAVQSWTGVNPWQRVAFAVTPYMNSYSTSSTQHTFVWCHSKPDTSYTDNNAWVDDIEFYY